MPLVAVGLFCVASVVLAPLGLVLIALGGVPLYRVLKRITTERLAQRADKPATRRVRKEELEVIDWEDEVIDYYGNRKD